ncbi:hypothetical protein B6N17_021595 [Stutzerimonas stutzeri]|uniref:hypothetical protein n=1 Tax=Stutzerimonas stutzeri TaxID=316 RepID=UPI000A0F62C5|nr:hypothetical protein [Stutzerimonas stutzeri]OSO71148.1 hypothetical protein B6N17_021595 [Stutzerimonas stutzeri]
MKVGTEAYNIDHEQTHARGVLISESDLHDMLAGPINKIINDTQGKSDIRVLLSSVVNTGFENAALESLLQESFDVPDWLIGEALAEFLITEERECEFPWPSSRDLKNPNSNATGADLVGFQKTGDPDTPYRFAFGEVKTSTEEKWPPQVVYGRGGLQEQIEDLKSSQPVKRGLFLYLGHHAQNSTWADMYISAAKRYLQSDYCDSSLFGVLVRDVEPKSLDLKQRAIKSSKEKPVDTQIAFFAIYLPLGAIPALPKLLAAKAVK